MPSFNFLDNLENYLLTGKYPPNATKSSRKVTRAASKNFIHKGGVLWRSYRGRLLRVVRSDEEIREVLTRYHDNNNHAGRVRAVKEIMLMYYWVGVTEAVKNWIQACEFCRSRAPVEPPAQPVLYCLVYGCEASSFSCPELTFHRFPKDPDLRSKWLALAQRDEGSLRLNSYVCSRHFEPLCFTLAGGDGERPALTKDAVPTVVPVVRDEELPVPSEEDFLQSTTLDDLLSTAAAAAETISSSDLPFDAADAPAGLHEHQYSLPESGEADDVSLRRRKTTIEPTFTVYNQIARYLSHRALPVHSKKCSGAFKRMAKRFGLVDGVLMYTRVTPALRVPRSKEEVNSILQQFHNNQGHNGQSMCQREISKHFYWGTMTRDLARWISTCHTCVHRTKRKWLRCSVYNCTNCCGPVERGLGLTFHNFPLNNTALLAQWLKAVGRSHWHPRLRSSICSTHFTEDCFDRSGDKVVLRPDAVPTLVVHNEAAAQSVQTPPGEEVYFAKYDAVELYLTSRTYPPGLSYVEKNTFRRFCKKFAIKDGVLHMVRGERLRLVLRSRQQVESALTDYHDELNHLDVNKCLRLLNERYFWKTMRPDVAQWISNCSHCSMKKGKKPERRAEAGEAEAGLQTVMSPLHDSDSFQGDSDDGFGDDGDAVKHPASNAFKSVVKRSKAASSHAGRSPFPIVLRLTAPVIAQSKTSVVLQQQTPNGPPATRTPAQRRSEAEAEGEAEPEPEEEPEEEPAPPAGRTESSDAGKNSQAEIRPASPDGATKSQKPALRASKRTKEPETGSAAKRGASGGLEPVVAPSTKPWPVFTIAGPAQVQIVKQSPEADSLAASRRSRKLQARVVVQQCSQARVKTKPGLDGAEDQWAQIEDGLVAYVCFFQGAAESVVYEVANSLMTTKLFRKDSRHLVSVLDRPGSVLLVPQDSLIGEPLPGRRLRLRDGCELWWGAQLFSGLAAACRELMAASAKCVKGGAKVEQGVYGQKQEMVLSSAEPQTIMLEF
ncbi:unnamed protein product [Ophioblennius macclurei]